MSERLLSVGLDVGTTSTQLIVSELEIENRASSFAVPDMEIARRTIRYKSPVHFTPLLDESHVDGPGIREILEAEYRAAGIRREDVDTGAVIITGETSRKENAQTVLEALSDLAGDFVVATAGPHLESVLAAKGAGAVEYSADTGATVLHMDIGGGTANLALIREGAIVETGCLNVGGRLLKFDEHGITTYVSPVLAEICGLKVGKMADVSSVLHIAELLTQALEMAAGLREPTELLAHLWTKEAGNQPVLPKALEPGEPLVISFSGGVADCIGQEHPWLAFGDMGPLLGQAIRKSRLCQGPYRLGTETIRATVIGAGCHSAQLSGSTVFAQNIPFPLKNLPVAAVAQGDRHHIRQALARQGGTAVLALPGIPAPSYAEVQRLAKEILAGVDAQPVLVCLEQDMAKALGQVLALELGPEAQILCIDRVRLTEGSYLDVGAPVGPALPVVVKTLVLGR